MFLFLVGLSLGSFVGVWISREGRHLWSPSFCETCHKTLSWHHLVPLISYLYQRGLCSFCQASIPAFLVVTELVGALLFSFMGWIFPDVWIAFFYGLALICLFLLCWSDWKTNEIPLALCGGIILPPLFMGTAQYETSIFLGVLFSMLLFFYRYARQINVMGEGDVFLASSLGLWIPFSAIPLFLILSGLGGVLTFLFRKEPFPFAPSLAISTLIIIIGEKPWDLL